MTCVSEKLTLYCVRVRFYSHSLSERAHCAHLLQIGVCCVCVVCVVRVVLLRNCCRGAGQIKLRRDMASTVCFSVDLTLLPVQAPLHRARINPFLTLTSPSLHHFRPPYQPPCGPNAPLITPTSPRSPSHPPHPLSHFYTFAPFEPPSYNIPTRVHHASTASATSTATTSWS